MKITDFEIETIGYAANLLLEYGCVEVSDKVREELRELIRLDCEYNYEPPSDIKDSGDIDLITDIADHFIDDIKFFTDKEDENNS